MHSYICVCETKYNKNLKMFKVLSSVILIVTIPTIITAVEISISKRNNLHDFMNDHELDYYFGPKHKRNAIPDYEIIDLPLSVWEVDNLQGNNQDERINDRRLHMEFNAFGNPVQLQLQPNRHLLAPNVKIVESLDDDRERILKRGSNGIENCHYLHTDDELVAAVSNCRDKEVVSHI